MAIKKRKIKKRFVPKPKPLTAHEKCCNRLYKMLNAEHDDPIYEAAEEICGHLRLHPSLMSDMLAEAILSRFDAEVKTLQVNYESKHYHPTYRVMLNYTDRTKPALHGYRYPHLYCLKTSHRLSLAASLAYVEICKHIGRFV